MNDFLIGITTFIVRGLHFIWSTFVWTWHRPDSALGIIFGLWLLLSLFRFLRRRARKKAGKDVALPEKSPAPRDMEDKPTHGEELKRLAGFLWGFYLWGLFLL